MLAPACLFPSVSAGNRHYSAMLKVRAECSRIRVGRATWIGSNLPANKHATTLVHVHAGTNMATGYEHQLSTLVSPASCNSLCHGDHTLRVGLLTMNGYKIAQRFAGSCATLY